MTTQTSKTIGSAATERYAQQSREAMEQRWILDHLPLVRHIVNKITSQMSSRTDLDDLISAGTLGLVRAAKAYDPGREAEFKTYAYIRVRGAVIDELRTRSFVPPGVHKQLRNLREAYQRLISQQGGPPTDRELSAALGISVAKLYQLFEEARNQHFLSIHGLSDDRPGLAAFALPDPAPSPDAEVERKELLENLADAIRELPKRDRTVLLLYYERDLTMKETAEVLGVTESRVSQLHAGALFKLSMKLRTAP